MESLQETYTANTLTNLTPNGTCNSSNIAIRHEWGNLSIAQRLSYISALQCLKTRPSLTDRTYAPGVRSRYDDFQAAHIVNTQFIHFSGWFLPWHRQFVWLFENALRSECNYTGYQPYWDWSKYADVRFEGNPLFDGSMTSLGGNGRYVVHNGTTVIPVEAADLSSTLPAGTGGGCVYQGPLANWTRNLGLVDVLGGAAGMVNPLMSGFINGPGYNPRCTTRDFQRYVDTDG